jgi:hypothetical protein
MDEGFGARQKFAARVEFGGTLNALSRFHKHAKSGAGVRQGAFDNCPVAVVVQAHPFVGE